jgi:hypothetical protein
MSLIEERLGTGKSPSIHQKVFGKLGTAPFVDKFICVGEEFLRG